MVNYEWLDHRRFNLGDIEGAHVIDYSDVIMQNTLLKDKVSEIEEVVLDEDGTVAASFSAMYYSKKPNLKSISFDIRINNPNRC